MSWPRIDESYQELRESAERFAREVVAPVAAEHDEAGTFPLDVVSRMAHAGWFGLPFPEEVGGQGGDYFALCLVIEELARVDASVAITLEAAVSLGAMPLFRFGSTELKARWLPQLVRGEAIAGFGLTEPDAGSDASRLRTTAVRDGDEWVINGAKQFITNSGSAITAFVTVAAVTGHDDSGAPQVSTILVPSGTPGFIVGPSYSKVGWHASDTHPLTFDDCRVPLTNLVGVEGRGYAQFLQTLDEGRIAVAALGTGTAQGCLDESVAYADARQAFGRRIGDHQAIAFMLADMEVRAHLSRLSYYDAAERMLAGEPFKREASIAKLYATEAAVTNARDATQIHGGYGFMNEYPVARMWRDSKVLEIGEGTSQVQRLLIARALGF